MNQVSRLQLGAPDWSTAHLDAPLRRSQNKTASAGKWPAKSVAVLGADVLALAGALACAVEATHWTGQSGWMWAGSLQVHAVMAGPVLAALFAAIAVLVVFGSHNHYSRRVPFWTELRDIAGSSVAALLFTGCVAFLLNQQGGRFFPVALWVTFPVLAIAARSLVRRQLSAAGLWQLRTVVVGLPESASDTLAALQTERQLGYQVVGVVSPEKLNTLPTSCRWSLLAKHYSADIVVLSYSGSAGPSREMIQSLLRERVPFALMPQLEGLPVLGFEQTRFFSHDTVMFTFRNNLAKPVARFTKLAFDLVAATLGVAVLAPVLAVIAVLVKLDGGPALFGHVRIGRNGQPFRCLKFRSMVVDSEATLRTLLAHDPAAAAEWSHARKLRKDPRITRIGRVLRATSLDEIPQLFNVLRLEMSLVGPRPIVAAEIARYGDDVAFYYETRPGLTGLWQVSGRTETSYVKRVQLDTWYVKNWTLWHDVAILAKTIPAVLQRRGAV